MDIAVIGAGAMGCLFGGKLGQIPENKVVLVDTWKEHVQKINADGLSLDMGQGVEQIAVKAALASDALEPADLVIVLTKSQHTLSALEGVKGVFKNDSIALTLQNGLGNAEKLAQYVPMAQVIVGITTFPSDILGPGIIRSEGTGKTLIMSADGVRRSQTETIADMFDGAGFNCSVSDDIYAGIWEKVAFNAALNSLAAVTRLPTGGIGSSDEGRRLSMQIAAEVIGVANHKGINANLERCRAMIEQVYELHKDHQPSMLQDILAKRTTEIDAINGAVAHEARQLGLAVPATALLADLVKMIEKSFH